MRVSLYATCLVDLVWPSVGTATVEILRRAGCEVDYDPRQTCCGQPAFNTGYREDARRVARRQVEILEERQADAVVVPSGSCASMLRRLPELFADEPGWLERARALAGRVRELSTFLVRDLGAPDLGARFEGRLSWHDACHGLRELGIRDEPRRLIRDVRGAELVECETASDCCGFGGTFSVRHPEISVAMLDRKLEALMELGVDAVVSGDVSCLMQIGGRLERLGSKIRPMHLAELLASRGGQESP